MPNYGDNIRARREAIGMSQVELAEKIGESKQTVWKYESGTVTNIPLPKVEAIAKALHCSPEDITGWNTNEKNPASEESGMDELDRQLMAFIKNLNSDQKRFLLAQLQTLTANQGETE